MRRYILRRLVQAVPLLFLISLLAFLLVRASGDPMSMYGASANLSDEDRARIVSVHGWDKPKIVQYVYWLSDVLHGDWGASVYTHQAVSQMILDRLPNTLILMGSVFLVTLLIAIPLGVASAVRPNSALDHVATAFSFIAFALPTFWLGLVLIMVFAVRFKEMGWPSLPAGGMYSLAEGPSLGGLLQHLLLPTLVLSIVSTAGYIRYLRAGILDALQQDYIRTARSKGLSELRIVWVHSFRNAILPLVTLIALNIPRVFSGALVTEQVFAWPGMGRLFVDNAARADYPVLMGLIMSVSVLVVLSNLVVDVAYAYLDPRIRLG
jgi:peptide/nickel transport system permease protein